jgi:hypothetical protein
MNQTPIDIGFARHLHNLLTAYHHAIERHHQSQGAEPCSWHRRSLCRAR